MGKGKKKSGQAQAARKGSENDNNKKVSAKNVDSNDKQANDSAKEVWDVVNVVKPKDLNSIPTCRMDGCDSDAVAVWAVNVNPDDLWPVCEDCQEEEFGGWPEGMEPKDKEDGVGSDEEGRSEQVQGKSSTEGNNEKDQDSSEEVNREDNKSTESELSARKDTNKSNEKTTDDDDEEEDETWDLVKIMSTEEVTGESMIKCSSDGCLLAAACVYVSNNSQKWYTCLDCQEKDYDGWPPLEELPIAFMSDDHKAALQSKCSKKSDVAMPDFAASPCKGDKTTLTSHTVTPPPNGATQNNNAGVGDSKGAIVTPHTAAKAASKKPNKQALAMHRKWQEAAEAMGGPGTRIVVSKESAKKLIFDYLFDSFSPMNITQIYKGLKGVVPSPVLKTCLDDMVLNGSASSVQFADSDEEDEDEEKKPASSDAKASSGDPFAGSLTLKAGKSPNAALYYVDYNVAKNGNGLDREDRNELMAQVVKAQAEETALKNSIKQMNDQTKLLLSQPTNEELTNALEVETSYLAELKSRVEAARKLRVNEEHKKQLKRRIQNMSAEWRKRRRICMDFLIAMEESTEGTISVKKVLAGDGQIEIDSDEVVAKHAIDFAKKKRQKPSLNKKRSFAAMKTGKSESPGVLGDENFVGVTLDSQGRVQRVYLDDDKDA